MNLHLIHWNADEARERAANLVERGFKVSTALPEQGGGLRSSSLAALSRIEM